ncbi:MAG TPA: hypothetical protein VFH49_04535, partial [Aquabacterium sp.]|nr:hypothetical protein [Aquabacterium sp.]
DLDELHLAALDFVVHNVHCHEGAPKKQHEAWCQPARKNTAQSTLSAVQIRPAVRGPDCA